MLEIQPFSEVHLEDAAEMVCAHVARLHKEVPELPGGYEETAAILPLLTELIKHGDPGAAAILDRRLVGFLAAWQVPSLHGVPSTYSPEWAHAAEDDRPEEVYQALYRHLSRRWVREGYFTNYISLLPHDHQVFRIWNWLGFGMFEVDAIRSLERVPMSGVDIVIRDAQTNDLDDVLALDRRLWEHVRSAPVFLPIEPKGPEFLLQWIEDPQMHVLLAYLGDAPVAYMVIGPANPEVCTLIFDQGTASIYRAYTATQARGEGIASALLNRALAVSQDLGYVRCAVDYEAANPEAVHFWGRYFKPACYSLQRVIDPRFVSEK